MSGAEPIIAAGIAEGLGAAGTAALATPIATTTAAGVGSGLTLGGSGLALGGAGTGAGLAAGGSSMAPLGALAAEGMGAQGLIAPSLVSGSTFGGAGATGATGMGGGQGLMATLGTSANPAAPFATASPGTFDAAFTVGDGLNKLGKGAEYASKMNSAMGAMSPQQKPVPPARQMQQTPNQSMAGLLGNPDAATQARMMKLKRLGLLG